MDSGTVFAAGVGVISIIHLAARCERWVTRRRFFAKFRTRKWGTGRASLTAEWYCFFKPSVFAWGPADSGSGAVRAKKRASRIVAGKKGKHQGVHSRRRAVLRS